MKRAKNNFGKLVSDAAFVAALTLVNRCLESKEKPMVKRDGDEASLNKKLAIVSLVYHAIGVFYNE